MGVPEDTVFVAVKPLYGIPERGLHSYIMHLEYHLGKLGMSSATENPLRACEARR